MRDGPARCRRCRSNTPTSALWQRAQLADGTLERQLDYWRGALAGVPDTLDLPLDRPRHSMPGGATRSARAGISAWSCDAELVTRLRGVARRSDATLFMLMLTATQAVLSRWSGQSDLVVGTPVAQRTRPETASLIGFFVNTLALRARFEPGTRFADALRHGAAKRCWPGSRTRMRRSSAWSRPSAPRAPPPARR